MSESIRRSSRQPKKSTTSLYNVGDIVEITRNNVVAEGRLAYLLTEGTSANPRWLVKFDKEAWKDEELYERTFGKLVKRGDGSKPKTATTSKTSSSSEGEETSKKKKSVAFTEESSEMVSDSSSSKIKALAREERATRRQASMEVVKKRPLKNNVLAPANKRVKTNNDEVIVVPMLTGTLYLYRGLNRRAEFVRRC